VFIVTLKTSGYVSLSSTFAILTVCITATIQEYCLSQYLGKMGIEVLILFYTISVFMIVKHWKNYIRIFKGTEHSFKKHKGEKISGEAVGDDDKKESPKEEIENPDDAVLEIDEQGELKENKE
jgi:hypothetical protein